MQVTINQLIETIYRTPYLSTYFSSFSIFFISLWNHLEQKIKIKEM